MITTQSILDHLESLSLTGQTITKSLIVNSTDAQKEVLHKMIVDTTKKALKNHPTVSPLFILENNLDGAMKTVLNTFELAELYEYYEVLNQQSKNSWMFKIPGAYNLGLLIISKTFGLDYNLLKELRVASYEEYTEIGDALVLSALYFELKVVSQHKQVDIHQAFSKLHN